MINQFKETLKNEQSEKDALKKNLEDIQHTLEQFEKVVEKNKGTNRRGRKLNKGKQKNKLYEIAISILKQHTASVQSVELKRELESKSGKTISNMTTFMQALMKKDSHIEKPYRGAYFYRQENTNETTQENMETNENHQLSSILEESHE